MKKITCIMILAAAMMMVPVQSSQAHSYDRDDDGHLFRYVAFLLHPIGIALEYGITRPIHKWISSDRTLQIWFGHDARPDDDYDTWK